MGDLWSGDKRKPVPQKATAPAVSYLLTAGATASWVSDRDSSCRGQREAGWDMFVSTGLG